MKAFPQSQSFICYLAVIIIMYNTVYFILKKKMKANERGFQYEINGYTSW